MTTLLFALAQGTMDNATWVQSYGPYGFGVASLLLIWFVIVAPQLKANKVDLEKVAAITAAQSKTADLLNAIVTRLEAVTVRLTGRSDP